MKKILLTLIGLTILSLAKAQTEDSVTVKTKRAEMKIDKEGISINIGKDSASRKVDKYPKVSFGIVLENFDLGLSKYHTGSDFSVPAAYSYLESKTWKTHNIGFDLVQFGVRFTNNFKISLGAGLDWNHIRLTTNETILPEKNTLTPDPAANNIVYSKNRFSSRYLRVPLMFELRTNQIKAGKRLHFMAGPEVGFLLNGKVKQVSDEKGKTKVKDDFNFEPFRYGAVTRLGYGDVGINFKYYFNDVFAKNQGPADYKNFNFGLTFGF